MFDPNSVFKRRRNSRCKAWLKDPVENPRSAFCCSGCEAGFYRGHCRVCEEPFKAKNSRKELCGQDSCEHEFRRNKDRFFSAWYRPNPNLGPSPKLAVKPEKSSTKSTAKTTIKSDRGSDRGWVQVAGPKLSPLGFHCATVGAGAAIGESTSAGAEVAHFNPSGTVETVAVDPNDPDEIWPAELGRQVKFEYDRLLTTTEIGKNVSGCDLSGLHPKRVQLWRDRAWQAAVRIVMGERITGHADWPSPILPDGSVLSDWRPATGEPVSTRVCECSQTATVDSDSKPVTTNSAERPDLAIPDDLSIPIFLRRTTP